MKHIIKMMVEHNPRHYTPIRILGEKYNVCSRCLGTWTAGIISFFVFAGVYFSGHVFEFYQIALLALGLAFICFIDWVSAKTSLRTGSNNTTRIVTGGCLGVGINLWFWLLPVPWVYRILSLMLLSLFFSVVIFIVNYHELKQGLFDCYNDFFNSRKRIYDCSCAGGCCGASCCALPEICCYGLILGCCCICPALICYLLIKK
jgi:uncharacterized membrane protein